MSIFQTINDSGILHALGALIVAAYTWLQTYKTKAAREAAIVNELKDIVKAMVNQVIGDSSGTSLPTSAVLKSSADPHILADHALEQLQEDVHSTPAIRGAIKDNEVNKLRPYAISLVKRGLGIMTNGKTK